VFSIGVLNGNNIAIEQCNNVSTPPAGLPHQKLLLLV